ncbi:microsomal glutathione S-transferase 1-like [Cololabis saira]|uniref:microsomal glutathione S-transferase 1-like n=1 Tax=Cololabis saira TaxID=129043 RepID=UPI002AD50F34|nr:microsomal glutathione S-transferase 1-like [Cololabis saira]XP_061600131.1 microsomal glutathione S-transferase 1-like [Cololabis saira]
MAELMENPAFRAFATHAAIVVLKMLLLAPMTAFFRFKNGSFSNEEDVAGKSEQEKKKMMKTDPDVERVRRCHLNDLENIVPFVVVGLLYALTGPDLSSALLHFRLFTGSRVFHTVSYVWALPQPCRALSFLLGVLVVVSMAYRVLSATLLL